jgi:hypothetical protein
VESYEQDFTSGYSRTRRSFLTSLANRGGWNLTPLTFLFSFNGGVAGKKEYIKEKPADSCQLFSNDYGSSV